MLDHVHLLVLHADVVADISPLRARPSSRMTLAATRSAEVTAPAARLPVPPRIAWPVRRWPGGPIAHYRCLEKDGIGVVRRSTEKYAWSMTHSSGRPTDISVRQFVADSGAVTRGLRQGRAYTLTLNGEPLARMIPIRQRRAVPKEEVLAIFATAPVVDGNELRADLDEAVSQDLRDPYEGTGM